MAPFDVSAGPLAVIAAPLLWPIAAILQLLFPVILWDRVRAYRWACAALVTESGLLVFDWLLTKLWPGHLHPLGLTWSLVAVTGAATVAAWRQRAEPGGRPHRVEWVAFTVLLAVFGGRGLISVIRGRFDWDFGTALCAAAAGAFFHLVVRHVSGRPVRPTTQQLFLTAWSFGAIAAAFHQQSRPTSTNLPEPSGTWPTFRADVRRTGSLDTADAGPNRPRVLWHFRCPGDARIYASPVVVGGELIVVATPTDATGSRLFNRVYWLDTASGKLIQSVDLPRAGISSPAVRGPLVVLGEGYHEDRDCHLRILDRRSAMLVGLFPTTSHVESSPALDGNRVYFGAGEDGIFAIDLADDGTPRPLWHVRGDHVDAAPAVAGGTVYVGSVTGDAGQAPGLIALDAGTGDQRWRMRASLSAIAGPAVDGEHVFFALGNGKLNRDADRPAGALWCLHVKTGHRLWQVEMPASLYASPVCVADRVVVAGGDGQVRCFRQVDGGRVWQAAVSVRVVAGPIVSGGAVYVVGESGLLVRLDAETGGVKWRFDELEEAAPGRDVRASPVLAGGRIFLAAGGSIFCIGDRGE